MSEAGKEFGDFVKALRESKYEDFVANTLPALQDSEEVNNITEECFCFAVSTKNYGVIDIFPKSNKIRIRRQNKWVKPILPWLRKYIIKKCIS
jgi:hypothetical protein|nr:MAG TPA: hypothetical protein [Caudoviricetes sp.]